MDATDAVRHAAARHTIPLNDEAAQDIADAARNATPRYWPEFMDDDDHYALFREMVRRELMASGKMWPIDPVSLV